MATQLQRLTLTPTGRALLQLLGHTGTLREAARLHLVPDHVRSTLTVAPIPRNMDPLLHQGRREARVEALALRYGENNTTCYTDAALYDTTRTRAVAVVLDHHHRELASASLHCQNITEAEEVAIALAIAQGNKLGRSFHVLTDCQAACRNYLKGRVSQPALNILLRAHDAREQLHIRTPPIRHKIIWTPGHAGLEGNQAADRVARGYTSRAPDHPAPEAPVPVPCDYSSILNYYKGTRRKYSPHRSLTKEEATSWGNLSRQVPTPTSTSSAKSTPRHTLHAARGVPRKPLYSTLHGRVVQLLPYPPSNTRARSGGSRCWPARPWTISLA